MWTATTRMLGVQAMTTVVLTDFDPKTLISSNQRLHHHAKAKLTKGWRTAVNDAITVYRKPLYHQARIVVYLRFPTNHRRDVGNYYPTAKACVDGLVDAGVLPDDSDQYVTGPDLRRDYPNGPHRIRIQIEELP